MHKLGTRGGGWVGGVGGGLAIVGESANKFRGETVRVWVEKSTHLKYYKPIFQFYAPWKYQKTILAESYNNNEVFRG